MSKLVSARKAPPKVEWPADRVARWPIGKLLPYARNARSHSPAQIAQLAASIREWGWTIPVLVDETGSLIAGHGRVLAARELDIETIPTMIAKGWTEAQIKAYRLADNKLALNAAWDADLLAIEIADLRALGASIEATGFSTVELSSLLGEDDAATGWNGMPEFEQGDVSAFRSLIVHFRDQIAVDAFANEIEPYIDKRYAADTTP